MMRKKTGLLAILLLATMMAFGPTVSADSLQNKLEQCRKEFVIAHDKNVSQKGAQTAKLKHLKLMKELLAELNEKNIDMKMTNAEIQENLMVVSHLLEMIVTEDLANKMRDMEFPD